MQDNLFGITANSLTGVIPFYAFLSIVTLLLLVLVIRLCANALSGSKPKAGPELLHVVPNATASQSTWYVDRTLGARKGKKQPLSADVLSTEVKHLLEQDPARAAESKHEQCHVLEFKAIEAPEIEPCGGVEAAFERYCAAAKAGRSKNLAGNTMGMK
ncbi:MAG TPA: hypothetical protein VH308_09305 [Terracidiphilus sp.]|jgi:hypothetical protein|nr:hypothetical protein [Terracidiphilus sp.]